MTHPLLPPLRLLTDLEARYDGPIPAPERRIIAFGSSLAAEIAEMRGEIAFFRAMVRRTRRDGKAWLGRGNHDGAARALADSRRYRRAWRNRRRRLATLLQELGKETTTREIRVDAARRNTLAVIAAAIVTPPIDNVGEPRA